jgi:hypothetical protein
MPSGSASTMLGKSRIYRAALLTRGQDLGTVTRANLETADSEGQGTDLDIPDTASTETVSRASEMAGHIGETKARAGTATVTDNTAMAGTTTTTATQAIGIEFQPDDRGTCHSEVLRRIRAEPSQYLGVTVRPSQLRSDLTAPKHGSSSSATYNFPAAIVCRAKPISKRDGLPYRPSFRPAC